MKKELILMAAVVLFAMYMPQTTSAENLNKNVVVLQQEVEYEEIDLEDLPTEITDVLKESFTDYELVKAYEGNDHSYKVILTKEDESVVLYFDKEGKLVKEEPLKG